MKLIGDSTAYDDEGVCTAHGYYRKAHSNLLNNTPRLVVVPNPANDFCTVYYELTKDINAIIYIYDSYGKLVIQNPLVLNSTSQKLNVNFLSGGLYNFILKSNAVEIGNGKFCIIR